MSLHFPSSVIQLQDTRTGLYLNIDDYGLVTALTRPSLSSYSSFVAPTSGPSVLISASALWLGGNGATGANAPMFVAENGYTNEQSKALTIELKPAAAGAAWVLICVNDDMYLQPSPAVDATEPGVPLSSLLSTVQTPWMVVPGCSAFRLQLRGSAQYVCPVLTAGVPTGFVLGNQTDAQVFEAVNRAVFLAGTYKYNSSSKCVQAQQLSLASSSTTVVSAAPQAVCVGTATNFTGNNAFVLGPSPLGPATGDAFQTSSGLGMTAVSSDGHLVFSDVGAPGPAFLIEPANLTSKPFTSTFQAGLAPFGLSLAAKIGIGCGVAVVVIIVAIIIWRCLKARQDKAAETSGSIPKRKQPKGKTNATADGASLLTDLILPLLFGK